MGIKRNIAIATVVMSMTMGLSSVASAFSDVQPSSWYHKEVTELQTLGVVKGYDDNTFRPNNKVSKAEALALTMRAVGIEGDTVPKGSKWYEGLVKAGLREGVIKGSFKGEAGATRREVADMLVRGLDLKGMYAPWLIFEDMQDEKTVDSMIDANILYKIGVTKGELVNGKRYFKPDRIVSRAEMNALTHRVMRYIKWRDIENGKDSSSGSFQGEVHGEIKPFEGIEDIKLIEKEPVKEEVVEPQKSLISSIMKKEEMAIVKEPRSVKELIKVFAYMGYNNLSEFTLTYKVNSIDDIINDTFKGNMKEAFEDVATIYPEYYSFTNRLGYTVKVRGSVAEITLERKSDTYSKTELVSKQDEYRVRAEEVVVDMIAKGKITESQTQKEKAKVLFEWVVDATEYDKTFAKESYTGYGQLFTGKAVCQGYTATYNLMLKMLGIETQGVSGKAGKGAKEEHIWTKAVLDGKTVFIDTTWGDSYATQGKANYKYFATDGTFLSETHDWDKVKYGY